MVGKGGNLGRLKTLIITFVFSKYNPRFSFEGFMLEEREFESLGRKSEEKKCRKIRRNYVKVPKVILIANLIIFHIFMIYMI